MPWRSLAFQRTSRGNPNQFGELAVGGQAGNRFGIRVLEASIAKYQFQSSKGDGFPNPGLFSLAFPVVFMNAPPLF